MATVPKGTYTLRITDSQLIQEMKAAKNGKSFDSDIFKLHKMKWSAKVSPVGRYKENTQNAKVSLMVYLLAMPSHLSKVAVRYNLKFIEGNKNWSNRYTFDVKNGGNIGSSFFQRNELLKHSSFTFEITLELIQLYDMNG
eukprot:296734_1